MANTIRNFLVGVGFDYDNQGEQNVTGGLDSIKGKVLQLGAVVAGGFGLSELTVGFATAKDELGKFSQAFDVVPSDVNALGQALEHNGGSLSAFMGQLETLTGLRDRLLAGDSSFLGELGKFGIDGNVIVDAENATEAYIMLADQIANVSKEQARGTIGVLGFDTASLALLQQGTDEVRRIMAEERGVRDITDNMIEEAARFNDAAQRAGDLLGGFADHISSIIMPDLNDSMEAMNERLENNQSRIKGFLSTLKTGLDIATSISTNDDTHDTDFTYMRPGERQALKSRQNRIDNPFPELRTFERTGGHRDMARQNRDNWVSQNASKTSQQTTQQPITVNANLTLDGRVIDNKIIKVIAGEAQTAIDDINSSVEK